MSGAIAAATAATARRPRWGVRTLVIAVAVVALAALAWWRGGLLDLPAAPRGIDATTAGLADLQALGERARGLERGAAAGANADPALAEAARGLAAIDQGNPEAGLAALRSAVEQAPRDLVIGNAYRMAVFDLKRAALADPAQRITLAEQLPPYLRSEPIGFLERLRQEHPSREATLQLALGWADELLLYGALEIKAPASVQSVELLSGILDAEPGYVPALYGRGLNYLHRPARLVWPERQRAAPNAASQDLGRCVAIGRKVGGAPPRLVATLALTLGDAYAKEGNPERARSWWQIAENSSRDRDLLDSVRRRFGWENADVPEKLERELETRMLDLDHPLTDLAVMWGRDAS